MNFPLTPIQIQRLRELNAPLAWHEKAFLDARERDRQFQHWEKELAADGRRRLERLYAGGRPELCRLENSLVDALVTGGFVQVTTPILLSKAMLEKMSIHSAHPLTQQVFWVGSRQCLRPMLAPNLYLLMRKLGRLWPKPFRLFEIGPCFRKESSGSHHLAEFTMLNLVEVGLGMESRRERLEELAAFVMQAAGIAKYDLETKQSEIYGETIDVVAGMEVCSGAMGPHPLDDAWGITDSWVGLGFGLERLLMAREGYANIHRAGRSLAYLDGVPLKL